MLHGFYLRAKARFAKHFMRSNRAFFLKYLKVLFSQVFLKAKTSKDLSEEQFPAWISGRKGSAVKAPYTGVWLTLGFGYKLQSFRLNPPV